jgi:GT2 family glycosyltransferase
MENNFQDKCVAVILSWNTVEITPLAIDSLLSQSKLPTILVVDNGSKDGTFEILESKYGEKIEIIRNKKNLGFAGGANTAIKWAKDRGYIYLALLNSDAVADKKWIEELHKTINNNSKIGISTSKILKIDGLEIDTTGEEFFSWGLSSPRGRNERDKGQYDTPGRVFGGSGGASMYSMDMINKIGGFDNDFFAYYEDADLSFRANLTGWQVYYNPMAVVRHKIGASSSKASGMTRQMSVKNQPMLILKNIPLRYLPSVSLKFLSLWLGSLSIAIKERQFKALFLGLIKLVILLPKKLVQRVKIQHWRRKNRVKSKDIRMLIKDGLPDLVKDLNSVRFAKKIIFWSRD